VEIVNITLTGHFYIYDGYGSMNEYLACGLARAGASVGILPLVFDPTGYSDEFLRLCADTGPQVADTVLYASWMRPELTCFQGQQLFVRTMYESSLIPQGWAALLSRARAVMVASRFVADVFRSCGVTAPIAVVPDGVDPAVYRYEERPRRPGLTTLMVGEMQGRKHYREGIAAWQLAFADDPEARLVFKSRLGRDDGYWSPDPRIEIRTDSERCRGIAHWYRQADVLMALGNEGFGLPLIEGMATGLPVIALNSEGQADVCREAGDLVLGVEPAGWEPHPHYDDGMPTGLRAVPGVGDIAAKLRWVATHRDEAADIGRAASAWVHRNRSVWDYGPNVLAVIEEHGRSRPRRRRRSANGDSHGGTT
jgi:glycosyltransferase involved in cell wall biosynthesis